MMKTFNTAYAGRLTLSGFALAAFALSGIILAGEATTNRVARPDTERCKSCHVKEPDGKWHSLARYMGAER